MNVHPTLFTSGVLGMLLDFSRKASKDREGLAIIKIFKIMMALLTSQALIRSGEMEEYLKVLLDVFCMHQHSL